MTSPLAALSHSIARLVSSAEASLAAIRIDRDHHISGLLCRDDIIVTTERALPLQGPFWVVRPNAEPTTARPGARDRASNLAILRLQDPIRIEPPTFAKPVLGSIAIILAADDQAMPTVRLCVIHRIAHIGPDAVAVLDVAIEDSAAGAPVLDPDGSLLGLADRAPNGETRIVSGAVIDRAVQELSNRDAAASNASSASRRGWLGVKLQPIAVPDYLLGRAGQKSGRMIVHIMTGGPAERAGLLVGDVLLALDGTSASAPHSLRAFLGADRIGSTVEVRLLRAGAFLNTRVVITDCPDPRQPASLSN